MAAKNVAELDRQNSEAERHPIRFGIGVNGGEVIVGDIGYGDNISFTALGDAVNVAARLQDMTKELECQLVVSEEVCELAGLQNETSRGEKLLFAVAPLRSLFRTAVEAEGITAQFDGVTSV